MTLRKKLSLIGHLLLIPGIFLVFYTAPGNTASATKPDTVAGVPENPEASLYDLKTTVTDQDAQALTLDTFRGHPVMISMVYATCPYTCPLIIGNLQKIEATLPPSIREHTRTLLVSLDPQHDTPAVLKDAAKRHQIAESRWRLVATDEDKVREIAAALSVKYRDSADGGINHSAIIAVLDQNGVIRGTWDGTSPAVADITVLLTSLAGTQPSWGVKAQ